MAPKILFPTICRLQIRQKYFDWRQLWGSLMGFATRPPPPRPPSPIATVFLRSCPKREYQLQYLGTDRIHIIYRQKGNACRKHFHVIFHAGTNLR